MNIGISSMEFQNMTNFKYIKNVDTTMYKISYKLFLFSQTFTTRKVEIIY